ncbi:MULTISPECIES: hypothetical protein [unclassified Streptosporangium]|uniref:hypothetical protein n=1 Tax=unclassified Streptosporangium TaxID=2632669 RepID=UPI002E29368F|nr:MULTISPECIES: hypothetical protein [unclassified Streptosporangium]
MRPPHEPEAPARGATAATSTAPGPARGTGGTADAPRDPRETASPPRGTAVAREPEDPTREAASLAHRIADVVLRCPDVADLSGGPFGTVATYLPGERLPGVALRENEVEVSVVVRLGRPLPEIADEVRTAVAPMVGDRPVNVHIGGLR